MVEVLSLVEARSILAGRILHYLDGLPAPLQEDIRLALAMEGKLLHQPGAELDGRWALLPFCLARALSAPALASAASSAPACDVALAMECVVCATDLLDDVMDDDATPLIAELGMARVLNVALVLISLSQRMLLSLLELDLPVTLPARLMDMMQNAILLASSGQQRDLLAERRPACELTSEECLEIASAKAGALLSLACQMGAVCAGANDADIALCAEAGRLLGVAAQLDNDAHDLSTLLQPAAQGTPSKSDLVRGKKTLPIVLAAHALHVRSAQARLAIDFRYLEELAGEEREIAFQALREGIITTWGIALLYRERARDVLSRLLGEQALAPDLWRVMGLENVPETDMRRQAS
jgi:geranylgeranyl pyrophosphate synthase